MTISEEAEALRNVPLFSRADPVRLKLLAFTSQRRTYPEGAVFFHEGDPADATYLILSGSVDICLTIRGNVTAISSSNEGTLIGEAGVLTNRPRAAMVRARTETVALCIQKEDFLDLLESAPSVAIGVASILADRLSETTKVLRNNLAER